MAGHTLVENKPELLASRFRRALFGDRFFSRIDQVLAAAPGILDDHLAAALDIGGYCAGLFCNHVGLLGGGITQFNALVPDQGAGLFTGLGSEQKGGYSSSHAAYDKADQEHSKIIMVRHFLSPFVYWERLFAE
jgi:hypothetical protein